MQAFGFRKRCVKPELRHIPVEHFAVCEATGYSKAHGKALSSSSGPALMLLKKQRGSPSAVPVSPLFWHAQGLGHVGKIRRKTATSPLLPCL